MANVLVTNKSDKELVDSFEYQRYVFPVGETVEISEDAAKYIFCWGVDDKRPCIVRHAWAPTFNDIPKGYDRLNQFWLRAAPEQNRSLSPAVERTPLVPRKRGLGGVSPVSQ